MPVGTSTGGYYKDDYEYAVSIYGTRSEPAPIDPALKRVPVTKPDVEDRTEDTTTTVDMPSRFEERFGVDQRQMWFDYPRGPKTRNPIAKDLGYEDIKTGPIEGLEYLNAGERSKDPWRGGIPDEELKTLLDPISRMPPQAPTEPTGALKLLGGTQTPEKDYNTKLSPSEEGKFQEWKKTHAPQDSGEDYDLRGAYKAGVTPAENGHWPDTWKKPNHPTFSNESQYAKDAPDKAGRWEGEKFIPPKRGILNALTGADGKERYQTWPEKAVRSVIEGVELFGGKTPTWAMDPVTGEVRTDTQTVDKVFEAAGVATFGPMPVARKMVDGTLGAMAGVKAKGIDRNALGGAQTLEAAGKHSDEIYEKTGFFRGTDGRWRHEIDDSAAKVNDKWIDTATVRFYKDSNKPHPVHTSTLGEVMDHPELYKAYPELKDVTVKRDPNMSDAARWEEDRKILWLGKEAYKDKGTIMHEVQHAIQGIEGFAKGGAAASATEGIYKLKHQDPIDALLPHYQHLKNLPKEERTPQISKLVKHLDHIFKRYEAYVSEANKEAAKYYMQLAGEVEARNVDTRVELGPKARKEIAPIWTEDLPRNMQILRDKPSWTTAYGALDTETGKYIKPSR